MRFLVMPLFKRRWSAAVIFSVLQISVFSTTVFAGPMGFQGSWMSMGDLSTNWREVFVNYAVTPRDAIGVANTYMRSDDERKRRNLTDVTYTRLLKRWNQTDAQANLWFVGGVGSIYSEDKGTNGTSKLMASPGIQFDYETTRIYFMATQRLYRASAINHDYSAVRAGFSFYETNYDQTQPWLIVEARYMNELSDKVEVTPMLRFINRNYFIEAGVNNSSQPRFNFMYIF